jgi:hypothetical protein
LALYAEKRHAESKSCLRDTLDMKQRTLGLEHRSTLVTTENLAVLDANGRYSETEQMLGPVLEAHRRTPGAETYVPGGFRLIVRRRTSD